MNHLKVAVLVREDSDYGDIRQIIEAEQGLTLVGCTRNEDEIMQIIKENQADLFMMDTAVSKLKTETDGEDQNSYERLLSIQSRQIELSALEVRVTEMIQKLGIPANIRGYKYLRDSIILAVYDYMVLESVTKVLYPYVAKINHTTPGRVERSIRSAIETGWNRGEPRIFEEVFGYTVNHNRGKPTNSEFIAMLADNIRIELKHVAE